MHRVFVVHLTADLNEVGQRLVSKSGRCESQRCANVALGLLSVLDMDDYILACPISVAISLATKYIFNIRQVEFLGYIIMPIGIVIDLVRVKII